MRGCLVYLILFFGLSAWSNQCFLAFQSNKIASPQLFGLSPSDLSTHHLSQLSLQQNLKALNELSVNRPLDIELYKQILKKDPFTDNLAMGAARLAAHGLLNTKVIYQNINEVKNSNQLEKLIEKSFKSTAPTSTKISVTDNVVYLNTTSTRINKNTSNNEKQSTTNNVLPFGAGFQQVLNAAITSNLYNSGPVKVHLIQELVNLNVTGNTLAQLRTLSSGQLLVYKAAYGLSGSEVLSLKKALMANDSLDIASFIFLAQRTRSQLYNNEAFIKLFYKNIKIKRTNLSEITTISELIHNKDIEFKDIIEFLSEKANVNHMSQKPVFSLLQIAQIVERKKRNHIEDSVLLKAFDHNTYLGKHKQVLKKLLFQKKSVSGFKVYDLRDDSLVSSKLYTLLTADLVTFLALNPGHLNKFVQRFQLELKKLTPSRIRILAKRYLSKPKSERWELELYNMIISEAFSKAEQSL